MIRNEMDDRSGDPAIEEIEELLERSRPVPRAAFRGDLRRRLIAAAPPMRPRYLRLAIALCGGAGSLLLALVGIGVAGTGPFAA